MSDVSFEVWINQQKSRYTFDLERGVPVKLGDGTFGAVFRVIGEDLNKYALKIFYDTQDGTVIDRFEQEMRSAYLVRKALADRGISALEGRNIVLSRESTKTFKSSKAYELLKDYFDKSRLSISEYATVMPLFTCTLKELLERGAPAERFVAGVKKTEAGANGYQLLQRLTYPEREKVILPLIAQIALGLRTLHAANLHHHDLKPANILLKSEANDLVAAIADLGFLNPNLGNGATLRFGEGLPLGTRHYRSPEQKDYFDICEVDVEASPAREPIRLFTHDRKFRDTLIEPGDSLVFSKDPKKTNHKIINIEHVNDGSRITLEAFATEFDEDKRTQVILYKVHTARTDVFGLGAIIYDLMTSGRSPERFYDSIRAWDHQSDESESGIAELIKQYEQLTRAQTTHPDLATIFRPFRHDGRYPSQELMSILLKCMLSSPKDSYVNACHDWSEIFPYIVTDLTKTIDILDAAGLDRDTNPLWSGNIEGISGIAKLPSDFPTKLANIQSLGAAEIGKRIVLSYRLLKKIVSAVVTTNNSGSSFLAEFSPHYLRFDGPDQNSINSIGTIYDSEEQYWLAIESGGRFAMPNDHRDKYVPPVLTFDTRPVYLNMATPEESCHEEPLHEVIYKLQYKDSCPFWHLQKDDILLIDTPSGKKIVSRIVHFENKIGGGNITVVPLQSDDTLPFVSNIELSATVIKKLYPIDYYLSMIGIYIHHLFFVDMDNDSGSVPDAVYLFRQAKSTGLLKYVIGYDVPGPEIDIELDQAPMEVFHYLSRLYTWIICGDYQNTDLDTEMKSNTRILGELSMSMDKLRVLIAKAIGKQSHVDIDVMSEAEAENESWNLVTPISNADSFNEMITKLVQQSFLNDFYQKDKLTQEMQKDDRDIEESTKPDTDIKGLIAQIDNYKKRYEELAILSNQQKDSYQENIKQLKIEYSKIQDQNKFYEIQIQDLEKDLQDELNRGFIDRFLFRVVN